MTLAGKVLRIASGGLVLAGAFTLAACTENGATPVVGDNLMALGDAGVLYGMRSYLHTEGTRSGVVVADSAFEVPDSSRTRLFGMQMTLYYEDGRDRARVTADSAVLNQRTEELVAWGDVVAQVLDQNSEIASPELHYNPSAQQIWSDSVTVITQSDGSVTSGTAFRSDLRFQNWELVNPVGGVPANRRRD